MKRVSFRLSLIAFILLLSSCGNGAASPVPSQSESSRMDESVGSVFSELQPESSEEEPEPSGFLLPEAVRIVKADYDAIELATYDVFRHPSAPPADENGLFYGAEKDGLWGLIDENGTEVLPCESKRAPSLCVFGEWLWWGSEDSLKKLSGSVEEKTGRPFCVAHGGYARWFIAEEPGDVPGILWELEGVTAVYPAEEEDLLGDESVPVQYGTLVGGETKPLRPPDDAFWNYTRTDGTMLFPEEKFQQVGWFRGEQLAPVQKDGKWAYVRTNGTFATDFLYDSCFGSSGTYDREAGEYREIAPCLAYDLWQGTAPVFRDGKWGVLNGEGVEIVPCQYDGAAPYPGGAWLKSEGQWGLYLF